LISRPTVKLATPLNHWLRAVFFALVLITTAHAQVERAVGPPTATIVLVLPQATTSLEDAFITQLKRSMPETSFNFEVIKFDAAKLDTLITQVRSKKPDLIYTTGITITLALAGPAKAAVINDVPIVFAGVDDAVRARLVVDAKRPSRNVTGVTHLAPLAAQFNAMRQYNSDKPLTSIGIAFRENDLDERLLVEDLQAEATRQKLKVVAEPIVDGQDPAQALQKLKAAGVQWLYVGETAAHANKRLMEVALTQQLPVFSAGEAAVRDDVALYSLYSPRQNIGRFVAAKARQVLTGTNIGNISIEALQKHSLLVNMKTAAQLAQYPPLAVLNSADVVGQPAGSVTK
jgi:putative tryptophan/tyrosine transport system substrate-binding protein